MRHWSSLFSWDCVSGSSQRGESSSRRAMKLSHKLRGGDVYELLTEESPDIWSKCISKMWFDLWQAFNVEICWIYSSNSMASVNVPPVLRLMVCMLKSLTEKRAEMCHRWPCFCWKFNGSQEYCSIAIIEVKQLIDHCFAPASSLWGSHGQVLRPKASPRLDFTFWGVCYKAIKDTLFIICISLCSSCLNSSLRVTFFGGRCR